MASSNGLIQGDCLNRNAGLEPLDLTVEEESAVYTGMCPRNGASPMWCYGNTCIVRVDEQVFVSGQEKLEQSKPLNDCRWTLYRNSGQSWELQQADAEGRTREPCPLAILPGKRLFLSSNPTLLGPDVAGGGPARPEVLAFDASSPRSTYSTLLPKWEGSPAFSEHSYRSFAADASNGELILFQNVGYSHAEWALRCDLAEWHQFSARAPLSSSVGRSRRLW